MSPSNRHLARRASRSRPWQGALTSLLLSLGCGTPQAAAANDVNLESADTVNEGQLRFLGAPPSKPVHHHQNRIRIDAGSLASGWVELSQCHDHLDAVPRAQITFRDGFVRALRIDLARGIAAAWTEGASVQLEQVAPGARLCLSAEVRALHSAGRGIFNLVNGPYKRKFLDGYYPMRVTLEVDYPQQTLGLTRINPPPQPGLTVRERPGNIRLDALFEGELRTLIEFRQRDDQE